MSEIAPELVRLSIYKENTQTNTIPSYFPKNSNRRIYPLNNCFEDSKIKQDETYSIIQSLNLKFPDKICPDELKNKYKKTEIIYAGIDTPVDDLVNYNCDKDGNYFKIVEKDIFDQSKYEADFQNLSKYYNSKWHLVLDQDFTSVFCKARHIQVQKIDFEIKSKKYIKEMNKRKKWLNILDDYDFYLKDNRTKFENIFQEYKDKINDKTHIIDSEMKKYILKFSKDKISECESIINNEMNKEYFLCSSFAPHLRIGSIHELPPSPISDTMYIYMGNPNIELWIEDEFHNIIDLTNYEVLKGNVSLKLIVEGRM
ncbi:MAG: hypothetical protein LBR15_00600 [Methanobrevibacter sp.]|jgi:hypothetical protein|nr:hypothetical protein [Candidatus Methanovirga australis]